MSVLVVSLPPPPLLQHAHIAHVARPLSAYCVHSYIKLQMTSLPCPPHLPFTLLPPRPLCHYTNSSRAVICPTSLPDCRWALTTVCNVSVQALMRSCRHQLTNEAAFIHKNRFDGEDKMLITLSVSLRQQGP